MDYFPVLAYHKISPQKELGLTTISPDQFEQHLIIILESGFKPITFYDLDTKKNLPENPIILTFDDGYESVHTHALPILNKYDLKAVVFILGNYIGSYNLWEAYNLQRKYRHLDKNQIREMSRAGLEIGSHGMLHNHLPSADTQSVVMELNQSKTIIEDITGKKVISFCYPYGLSNNSIQKKVSESGYKYALGNLQISKIGENNPYHIGRRSIYTSDTHRLFRQKLEKPLRTHISLILEKVIRIGAYTGILTKISMNKLN